MRIFMSSKAVFFVALLRLFLPETLATTNCQDWCESDGAVNQEKCFWNSCSGCSFCSCAGLCSRIDQPWEEKCNFASCLGCSECLSHISTCRRWCNKNINPWSTKCGWDSCSECGECFFKNLPLPSKKPNILLIFADDVGTGDIPGYWGNENDGLVDMPHVYDLVQKGTTFTDAHSTPLCAPSRYMLLSGNYQYRGNRAAGTWGMGEPSQFVGNQKSIAEALRDEGGYHTAMMGKWHIGGKLPSSTGKPAKTPNMLTDLNHDWTLPLVEGPQTFGFDSSLITDQGIQGWPYSFFRDGFLLTNPLSVRFWETGSYEMPFGQSEVILDGEGDDGWDSSAYNMILVNETNRFLDDHFETRPNDPFFAYVALGAAHIPHSPPNSYMDGTPVAGETPTKFLDMLKELDLVVGSLTQTIEDRGLAEDTIIILTSDNGGLPGRLTHSKELGHRTGGPLRAVKGSVFEGGHRVPFIIRHDGVYPAGEQRNHLIGINDIYATLCDIAGVNIPSGSALDSVSFADHIVSDDCAGPRSFLGTWRDKGEATLTTAIRYNNYKLVFDFRTNVTNLFDLDSDVREREDLSTDPAKQDLIQMMFSELDYLRPM